jgi:hypothetical protein
MITMINGGSGKTRLGKLIRLAKLALLQRVRRPLEQELQVLRGTCQAADLQCQHTGDETANFELSRTKNVPG